MSPLLDDWGESDGHVETREEHPLPPHNVEAEEATLGAVLISPESFLSIQAELPEGDAEFYIHKNGWIWDAFQRLHAARKAIDFLTVQDELDRRRKLEDAGGPAYLTGLISNTPTSLNASSYARIVHETYMRRKLLQVANTLAVEAYNEKKSLEEVLPAVERAFRSITTTSVEVFSPEDRAEMSGARLNQRIANPGADFVTPKMGLIDSYIKFRYGQEYLVAGPTKMGKTFVLANIAERISIDKKVLLVSTEMSESDIDDRSLALHSGLETDEITSGKLGAGALRGALERMKSSNLFLVEKVFFLEDIFAVVDMAEARSGIPFDCVVIDHITDVKSRETFRLKMSPFEAYEHMLWLSSQLTIRGGVKRILIKGIQLNRDNVQRPDKHVVPSDLRGTDRHAQLCAGVYGLYRSGYWYPGIKDILNNSGHLDSERERRVRLWKTYYRDTPLPEDFMEINCVLSRFGEAGWNVPISFIPARAYVGQPPEFKVASLQEEVGW